MLDERVGTLRQVTSKAHVDMGQLIDGLREADLDRKTDLGWPVRALAGHIAQAPAGDKYVARRLSGGKNATLPGFLAFTIDVANWYGARKFRRAALSELRSELDRQYTDLVTYIESLNTYQLDQGGTVMGLGRLTTFEYLHQSPSHVLEHASSIQHAIGAVGGSER